MPNSEFPIIGIGGTNASGKDTVAQMLVEKYGWQYVSLSDLLRDELKSRGESITRKKLRDLSAQWRKIHGPDVLVDRAAKLFDSGRYKGLVVASLRNWGEADAIHQLGGKVVWVDANPKIRYQRIKKRVRDGEHLLTYKEFLADEQEEMEHFEGDKHTLNLKGVKDRADFFLQNNGTDIEAFKNYAEKALERADKIQTGTCK